GELAARYGALSADHLEYASDVSLQLMARNGVIAGLLPGAFYFLRETRLPPIEKMRELGVQMAVSTDCNPGTSPIASILLAMNMACVLFRMTAAEVLRGVTVNAARALGLGESGGGSRHAARGAARGPRDLEATSSGATVRRGRHSSPGRNHQNDTVTFSVA